MNLTKLRFLVLSTCSWLYLIISQVLENNNLPVTWFQPQVFFLTHMTFFSFTLPFIFISYWLALWVGNHFSFFLCMIFGSSYQILLVLIPRLSLYMTCGHSADDDDDDGRRLFSNNNNDDNKCFLLV